jgi:hypothetical protein
LFLPDSILWHKNNEDINKIINYAKTIITVDNLKFVDRTSSSTCVIKTKSSSLNNKATVKTSIINNQQQDNTSTSSTNKSLDTALKRFKREFVQQLQNSAALSSRADRKSALNTIVAFWTAIDTYSELYEIFNANFSSIAVDNDQNRQKMGAFHTMVNTFWEISDYNLQTSQWQRVIHVTKYVLEEETSSTSTIITDGSLRHQQPNKQNCSLFDLVTSEQMGERKAILNTLLSQPVRFKEICQKVFNHFSNDLYPPILKKCLNISFNPPLTIVLVETIIKDCLSKMMVEVN